MSAKRVFCAALALAALAAPACANPFDSLRWRVEDAIADTAARKVESALSGEGRKTKEKPAKLAPATAPAPAVTAPAPSSSPPAPPPSPIAAPVAAPVAAPAPLPGR